MSQFQFVRFRIVIVDDLNGFRNVIVEKWKKSCVSSQKFAIVAFRFRFLLKNENLNAFDEWKHDEKLMLIRSNFRKKKQTTLKKVRRTTMQIEWYFEIALKRIRKLKKQIKTFEKKWNQSKNDNSFRRVDNKSAHFFFDFR